MQWWRAKQLTNTSFEVAGIASHCLDMTFVPLLEYLRKTGSGGPRNNKVVSDRCSIRVHADNNQDIKKRVSFADPPSARLPAERGGTLIGNDHANLPEIVDDQVLLPSVHIDYCHRLDDPIQTLLEHQPRGANGDDVGLAHALAGSLEPIGAELIGQTQQALHTAQAIEHAVAEHALDQRQARPADRLGLLQAIAWGAHLPRLRRRRQVIVNARSIPRRGSNFPMKPAWILKSIDEILGLFHGLFTGFGIAP